jgi:hypothetical protein
LTADAFQRSQVGGFSHVEREARLVAPRACGAIRLVYEITAKGSQRLATAPPATLADSRATGSISSTRGLGDAAVSPARVAIPPIGKHTWAWRPAQDRDHSLQRAITPVPTTPPLGPDDDLGLLLAVAFDRVVAFEFGFYRELLVGLRHDKRHDRGAGLVLVALLAKDNRSLDEIADCVGLSSAGLDAVVDRLGGRPESPRTSGGTGRPTKSISEKRHKTRTQKPGPKALVERCVEGQRTLVRLTARGEALRGRWRSARRKINRKLNASLTQTSLATLRQGLIELVASFPATAEHRAARRKSRLAKRAGSTGAKCS